MNGRRFHGLSRGSLAGLHLPSSEQRDIDKKRDLIVGTASDTGSIRNLKTVGSMRAR